MTEFRVGIYNLIKKLLGSSSFTLAVIYTLGHILIAIACVVIITGASVELAALDAVIEPIINGVWFYVLHRAYKKLQE